MVTREQFFALKPEVKEVRIEALGGSVWVKQLNVGEMNRLHIEASKEGGLHFMTLLASMTVCDSEGVRIFEDGDVDQISGLPVHVFNDVVKAAVSVNKLGENDLKDLEGN